MSNESTVEQFKAEVAAMRVKEANVGLEKVMRIIGALLMVLGFVLAVYAIIEDLNAEVIKNGVATVNGPAEQRDAMVHGIAGVVFAIVGATVFIRYSFGAYLRYWLARLVFEQQRKS